MSESANHSAIRAIIAEAKRRHVFKTAALYAGGAFGVLQLADILMPTLGIDESAIANLLVIIAVGFPLALIAAWILDVSREGLTVTEEISNDERSKLSGPKLTEVLVVLIALGVGYLYFERFVGDHEVTQPEATAATSASVLEPSIAVLPFENLSASEDNAYFAAGIHEDILNNLSQIGGLIVTSRTSTLPYAGSSKPLSEIAKDLNVNYVIEGSVRRAGDRVRISVQLIEAGSDSHLWSEAYEREILDVFEIQRQIAAEVSHALKIELEVGLAMGERPTKSLEAYELLLQSRELAWSYEPESVAKAIAGYRRALALDPDYADAWAGLSFAIASTNYVGQSDGTIDEAMDAVDKALAINPESWMANYAKGFLMGNWGVGAATEAIPFFEKAATLNPNHGGLLNIYGSALFFVGDSRAAAPLFLAAYRRDPLSAEANLARANLAVLERDRVAAYKAAERAVQIAPNRTYVRWWAAQIYFNLLDVENGLAQIHEILKAHPDHLAAMFWAASFLTQIGDYENANYWLDRAEAISPNNTEYLFRRANNYALGGKLAEYQTLVNRWLEFDPENLHAIRYKPYATAKAITEALEREDMTAVSRLAERALQENLDFLKTQTDDQGREIVSLLGTYSILAAAVNAKVIGEMELTETLCRRLINYYDAQAPGANTARNMQLMLSYALLDDTEQAVQYAAAVKEEGFSSLWLLDRGSFGAIEDRQKIYAGLSTNLIFQDMIASLREQNANTRQRLQEQLPVLFPI